MRHPLSERRAGNLDGDDIGAPWNAGTTGQTATPDPFDWFFLTRVRNDEIPDPEGADLPLTTWRSDRRTAKKAISSALTTLLSTLTTACAHTSRPEGRH